MDSKSAEGGGRPVGRLAFAELNLRRNPFGEVPDVERGALAVLDVGPWREFLKQERAYLEFLGEAGRGKSTRLHALRGHFPEAPYCYFPEDGPFPEIPERAPTLFLDETWRLGWWTRRRLLRGGSRLICATHHSHARAARRAGRPVMSVTVEGLEPELLRAIIVRRVEAARRGGGAVPEVPETRIRALIARHGDALRAIEYDLYDDFEALRRGQNPWPRQT